MGGVHFDKADFGCETDTCLINHLLESYRDIVQYNLDSASMIVDFCLLESRKNDYGFGEVLALRLKADVFSLESKYSLAEAYSDGFQDQFGGPKDKKYKSAKMKRFITSIAMLPMEEQKEKLKEEFQSWKGSGEQVDDLLIIGFKA